MRKQINTDISVLAVFLFILTFISWRIIIKAVHFLEGIIFKRRCSLKIQKGGKALITEKQFKQQLSAHSELGQFVHGTSLTHDLCIESFSKRAVSKFYFSDKIFIVFCDKEGIPVEVICADGESWSAAIERVAGQRPMKEIYHISKKKGIKKITIFSTPTRTVSDANFQRKLVARTK